METGQVPRTRQHMTASPDDLECYKLTDSSKAKQTTSLPRKQPGSKSRWQSRNKNFPQVGLSFFSFFVITTFDEDAQKVKTKAFSWASTVMPL